MGGGRQLSALYGLDGGWIGVGWAFELAQTVDIDPRQTVDGAQARGTSTIAGACTCPVQARAK